MYSIGKQRLFYISKTIGNKTVEAEVINPSLSKSGRFLMTHVEDDIYYIDVTFKAKGSYIFRVYENESLVLKDILRVDSGQHLFYPSMDDIIV